MNSDSINQFNTEEQPVSTGQPAVNQRDAVTVQVYPYMNLNSNAFPKKINLTILPGLLIVSDSTTNQEQYRITLSPDIKITTMLGTVKITYMNGQKVDDNSISKYTFNIYNAAISPWFIYIFMKSKVNRLVNLINQAAGAPNAP